MKKTKSITEDAISAHIYMGKLVYWWFNGVLERDRVIGYTSIENEGKHQYIVSSSPERIYIAPDVFINKNEALDFQIENLKKLKIIKNEFIPAYSKPA